MATGRTPTKFPYPYLNLSKILLPKPVTNPITKLTTNPKPVPFKIAIPVGTQTCLLSHKDNVQKGEGHVKTLSLESLSLILW